MALSIDCPFGFEDGHIVAYKTELRRLTVEYEFWNAQTGQLLFESIIGVRDNCSIGVTVGSVVETDSSEFINLLKQRLYEGPPARLNWTHYQFRDLDKQPIFEVVAESVAFSP
jgi:hypothetical protein